MSARAAVSSAPSARRARADVPANERALRAAKRPLSDDAPLESDAEWFEAFRLYTAAQYRCAVARLRRVHAAAAAADDDDDDKDTNEDGGARVRHAERTLVSNDDTARLDDSGFRMVLQQARLLLARVEHVLSSEMTLVTSAPMRAFRERSAVLLNRVRRLTADDEPGAHATEWARRLEVQALPQGDPQACEITRQSGAVRQDTVVARVTLFTHSTTRAQATVDDDDDLDEDCTRRDHFFQEYYAQLAMHYAYLCTFVDVQQEEIFRALRHVPRTAEAHRHALGTLSEPGSLLRRQMLVYLRMLRYWAAFCAYYTTQLEAVQELQTLHRDYHLSVFVAECLPSPPSAAAAAMV